jgi:solute carrier family 36 (proton-coupled amino acid transporter)
LKCSDCDTLTHLLKASLGSGILSMPLAFGHVGLTMGVIGTIFVAIICTHCSYILVKCAHKLYERTRVTALSFADVGSIAFSQGPTWAQPFATFSRMTILVSLFLTYFGTCSVYTVIIASNFQHVTKKDAISTTIKFTFSDEKNKYNYFLTQIFEKGLLW